MFTRGAKGKRLFQNHINPKSNHPLRPYLKMLKCTHKKSARENDQKHPAKPHVLRLRQNTNRKTLLPAITLYIPRFNAMSDFLYGA